jgi:predicted transcriptional regulator
MSTSQEGIKPRKVRPRPDLSIFDEELNVPFNKNEFLPDLPPHARTHKSETISAPLPNSAINVSSASSTSETKRALPVTFDSALKLSQSEAKVEPKLSHKNDILKPKLSQSEAKAEPKLSQAKASKERKVEPELRPQVEPKLSQSEAKVEPNPSISTLVGLQRDILLNIYNSCREEGSKCSAPISIENLANVSNTTASAARKAIQRIEQKGYITRAQYKDGRGGWTRYKVLDSVYNALLLDETRAKVEPKLSQTRAKVEPELEPKLRPSVSSSSSFIDLEKFKTTTTSESETFDNSVNQLDPVWSAIDTSPLFEIGFTKAHLIQLARHGKISAEEVQDSIHFFAFDLVRNGKARELKGPPLNFFMGILRKGLPYAPPENFESPEAEARRKYLEGKRRIEEQRLAEEQELKALAFATWRRSLTDVQARDLIPESLRNVPQAFQASLRVYFDEHVYQTLEAIQANETEALRMTQVSAAITQPFGETTR